MRELLQQALEALMFKVSPRKVLKVIAAIEEELSKPEQAAGKCGCGANLYVDENGKPCSKAKSEQDHGFDRTASHMAGEYVDTKQQNVNTSEERVQVSSKNVHEPVAWMYKDGMVTTDPDRADGTWTPLFTTSPQSTEQKPFAYIDAVDRKTVYVSPHRKRWLSEREDKEWRQFHYDHKYDTALYTSPPRKEWVGLSADDLSVCDEDGVILAKYWEAKLRSKNV